MDWHLGPDCDLAAINFQRAAKALDPMTREAYDKLFPMPGPKPKEPR